MPVTAKMVANTLRKNMTAIVEVLKDTPVIRNSDLKKRVKLTHYGLTTAREELAKRKIITQEETFVKGTSAVQLLIRADVDVIKNLDVNELDLVKEPKPVKQMDEVSANKFKNLILRHLRVEGIASAFEIQRKFELHADDYNFLVNELIQESYIRRVKIGRYASIELRSNGMNNGLDLKNGVFVMGVYMGADYQREVAA